MTDSGRKNIYGSKRLQRRSLKCGLFLLHSKASKKSFLSLLDPAKDAFFPLPALDTWEDMGKIHLLCIYLQNRHQ